PPTPLAVPYTTLFRSPAERRVEDDQLRPVNERCDELHLLKHALRKLFTAFALDPLQTDALERLGDPLAERRVPQALQAGHVSDRSEEHTSELQSRENL